MSKSRKTNPWANAYRFLGIVVLAVASCCSVTMAADGAGRTATLDEQLRSDIDEQLHSDIDEQLHSDIDEQLHSDIDEQLHSDIDEQLHSDIDEQLLDDLGGGQFDDLDRALFGPDVEPTGTGDTDNPGGETVDDLEARLRRELGEAAVSEDENPLLEVARTMREVEGRIAGEDSGLTTRGLQDRIVADLDALIERAKKKCSGSCSSQCNSSSQANAGGQPKPGTSGTSTNPAATSTPRDASGEPATTDEPSPQSLMRRLWEVSLPAQQRQQLLQSPFDEFLPKYERMIEQYFRRLAEGEEGGM